MRDDAAVERRLQREAQQNYLGRLGDSSGVNVARVEVSWYKEDPGLGFETELDEHAGYYLVHATGDEPDGIYAVFEGLVAEAMDAKVDSHRIDGWSIDDISAA